MPEVVALLYTRRCSCDGVIPGFIPVLECLDIFAGVDFSDAIDAVYPVGVGQ